MSKFTAYDGDQVELGEVEYLDAIPSWENALQRPIKRIVDANDGWIEDADGRVVYTAGDDDNDDD